MFLQKVYRYNKWLCGGMLFFVLGQLLVFSRAGMVFSPWFNYGMYSEVIKSQKDYAVYQVYADGKIMAGNEYLPPQWDRIHFTLLQTDAAACNGNFYQKEISRLFTKFHLPVPAEKVYVNAIYEPAQLKAQCLNMLAKHFNKNSIEAYPVLFEWNGETLVQKDSLHVISSNSFQCK